jgi:hypothetical protein
MPECGARRVHPELRDLVAEATRALASLDADRLEELALCCHALNRDLETAGLGSSGELAREARDAQGDMTVFGRVLDATRANLAVIHRIRVLRRGRPLEYGQAALPPGSNHGDH